MSKEKITWLSPNLYTMLSNEIVAATDLTYEHARQVVNWLDKHGILDYELVKEISMGSPINLYQEDISELTLRIHDWLEVTPLASTEEGYDHLANLIEGFLEPFNHGIRNFN